MQIQHIQKRLPLIIALACGIWAILLLNAYLKRREGEIWERIKQAQQQAQAARPQERTAVVLLAAKDIPAQTPITPEDVTFKQVPAEYIQPGAVTSLEEVIGQISASTIVTGEQISRAKLIPAGKVVKTLSEITPPGKRAVTVPVANISSVINLLRPGDYVDILALIFLPGVEPGKEKTTPRLITLFQGVEVLAIGEEFFIPEGTTLALKKEKGATTTPQTITFALTPQETSLLSFVQEHGKIKLALRSQEDTKPEPVAPADWDTLFKYLSSGAAGGTGFEGQPVVEIYRGLQKELVPLSEKRNEE